MILPGYCRGDLGPIVEKASGVPVESGPGGPRDLPRHFGQAAQAAAGYGAYRIEILAEINHAPRLVDDELIARPSGSASEGADVIDLGCDPGATWSGVGDAVAALATGGLAGLDRQLRPGRGRRRGRGRGRAGPERQRQQPRSGRRLGRRGRGDPRPARVARGARRRRSSSWIARACRSASTRSSSRSALASRPRWAVISRSAAAIPRPR